MLVYFTSDAFQSVLEDYLLQIFVYEKCNGSFIDVYSAESRYLSICGYEKFE